MNGIAARRGDLAVVVRTHHDYVIGTGSTERTTYTVGRVASITRDGTVKLVDVPSYRGSMHRAPIDANDRVLVQPAATIDVAAALDVARAHTWPGYPESPMPFESIEAVKAALAPFVR